jgi:hypothetical protein
MRHFSRALLVLPLVLPLALLCACADLSFAGKTPAATPKAPQASIPAAARASRRAIPLPVEARRRLESENRLAAILGPLPSPPDKPLIGLQGKAVVELLGRPGFIHRDPPAEIWRYRGANCLLDLFLYRRGTAMKVTHAEARGKQVEGAASPTACGQSSVRAGRRVPVDNAKERWALFIPHSVVFPLKAHCSRTTQSGQSGLRALQT